MEKSKQPEKKNSKEAKEDEVEEIHLNNGEEKKKEEGF